MFLVQTVEIVITQIVVRNLIREHMVDRHQNLMTDGHHRSFGAPSGFQAVVLVAQVGSLGSGGGLRGLHQGGLQIEVTLGDTSEGNLPARQVLPPESPTDRKSTRLNSSHTVISYAVFC